MIEGCGRGWRREFGGSGFRRGRYGLYRCLLGRPFLGLSLQTLLEGRAFALARAFYALGIRGDLVDYRLDACLRFSFSISSHFDVF
jgi:hypothetical protein